MTKQAGAVYALIMAGGVGSRFWPLSRPDRPKQFLSFFGEQSMLQMAVERLDGLVPRAGCFISTNQRYVDQTLEQLPDLGRQNIIAEPVGRNTAPCIAYGATRIADLDPEGVMLVLPADHLIQDVPAFHAAAERAVRAAREKGVLVTLGIQPSKPATGYGYIEFDPDQADVDDGSDVFDVVSFTEKPDEETARSFLESGRYLWNSGMFCWRVDTVLHEMERHIPDVHRLFSALSEGRWRDSAAVDRAFEDSPNVSIDYGVMEHAEVVKVVPCDIGWNDVGDWQAAYEVSAKDDDGNVARGDVETIDTSGCFGYSSSRRVVMLGTRDLVVVDAGDTVLVCDRNQAQRVKEAAKKFAASRTENGERPSQT